MRAIHHFAIGCSWLVVSTAAFSPGVSRGATCVVIVPRSGRVGGWEALSLGRRTGKPLRLRGLALYGATPTRLVTVSRALGGMAIQVWSLPGLKLRGSVVERKATILRTILPSIHGAVAVDKGDRTFFLPATPAGSVEWGGALVAGSWGTPQVRIVRLPRTLRGAGPLSLVAIKGGALVWVPRKGIAVACSSRGYRFGKPLRLPKAASILADIPHFGLVRFSLRGGISLLSRAGLVPAAPHPWRAAAGNVRAVRCFTNDGKPFAAMLRGRGRFVGGAWRHSEVVIANLKKRRVTFKKRFSFSAARSFGVSSDGKTICLIDWRARQLVFYDRGKEEQRAYPLRAGRLACAAAHVVGLWRGHPPGAR